MFCTEWTNGQYKNFDLHGSGIGSDLITTTKIISYTQPNLLHSRFDGAEISENAAEKAKRWVKFVEMSPVLHRNWYVTYTSPQHCCCCQPTVWILLHGIRGSILEVFTMFYVSMKVMTYTEQFRYFLLRVPIFHYWMNYQKYWKYGAFYSVHLLRKYQ
jgi:hypothetical protein